MWERALRWEDTHRLVVDALLAAMLALVLVPAGLAVGVLGSEAAGGWWSVALVVPLAWRRVRPTASAAAVYAVGLTHLVYGPAILPADLAVLVALYSVTVHGPRWAHRTAIALALVASTVVPAVVLDAFYDPAGAIVLALLIATSSLAAWAFGLVRRARRETLEALVDRAQRLEVERDQQALIATAAERARIAREMHDIVAHSLSVMIAQADGGRYAAQADPAAATRALGTIGETGRAALTDMRRLLGVLRSDAGTDTRAGERPGVLPAHTSDEPEAGAGGTTPQPSEAQIPQLVEQVQASGAHVSFVRLGTPRSLPPGVGLTVYRIAQEALTNVLKHAGPGPRVTVVVQWRPESIELDVADDGRGASAVSDGLGNGLRGMQERATMFGGTVTVGPRPGGGFRVRAHIPTPGGIPASRDDHEESPS
ncbi:sensor histidine kinase [Cellulomonas composti]|nr:sensor histidine kinase [Cellulomonas composti]